MEAPALTAAETRRLEALAKAAGRSPRAMLRFVLRDGFDYTEQSVAKARQGLEDVARGDTLPHAEVMKSLRERIRRHGKRDRAAA